MVSVGLGQVCTAQPGESPLPQEQLVISSFPNREAFQVPFPTASHVQSRWARPYSPTLAFTCPPAKVEAILVTDL